MTYNTFIYIVGALSTGTIIWFIGDKLRHAAKNNFNFSWQAFTDSVNGVVQAIGLKRERKQSIESFIAEMTAVEEALNQFRSRYQESRHLEIAFNAVTLGEARKYAAQIYTLLHGIQTGVGRIELAVSEATQATASQLNLPAMAAGLGANLPKPQLGAPGMPSLPAAQSAAFPPQQGGSQAEAPEEDGNGLEVKLKDGTLYVVTDFTTPPPDNMSRMYGSSLRQYILDKNLIVGETVTFWPAEYAQPRKNDASAARSGF